jgi:hypothetical protein
MPEPIKDWSLTTLKDKLIKIGAKVVSHGRYVAFQMAEGAIPRILFADILRLVSELRPPPAVGSREALNCYAFARQSIEKLRDLVTDLQLINGTRGIISIFSASRTPEDGGSPAPLFPDQLPEGATYGASIG